MSSPEAFRRTAIDLEEAVIAGYVGQAGHLGRPELGAVTAALYTGQTGPPTTAMTAAGPTTDRPRSVGPADLEALVPVLAEADAVVTAIPGLAVCILTADCAPVLLCDPQARVIGAAHAGWRGALSGIVEATVEAMAGLGAEPRRIRAAIGPAISQGAYEVGEDYKAQFLAQEPESEAFFVTDEGSGEPHFDLPGYVAERLARGPHAFWAVGRERRCFGSGASHRGGVGVSGGDSNS